MCVYVYKIGSYIYIYIYRMAPRRPMITHTNRYVTRLILTFMFWCIFGGHDRQREIMVRWHKIIHINT